MKIHIVLTCLLYVLPVYACIVYCMVCVAVSDLFRFGNLRGSRGKSGGDRSDSACVSWSGCSSKTVGSVIRVCAISSRHSVSLAFLTAVISAESFLYCMACRQWWRPRLGSVLLWPRPRWCLTLSTHARWRSWMTVSPDFTLQRWWCSAVAG